MKGLMVLRCFIGVFILLNVPQLVSAGMPGNQTDSLPPKIKSDDNADNKPVEKIIKAVPKARKQAVPVPVVIPVNPIKIVKPIIVKPVIKVRL